MVRARVVCRVCGKSWVMRKDGLPVEHNVRAGQYWERCRDGIVSDFNLGRAAAVKAIVDDLQSEIDRIEKHSCGHGYESCLDCERVKALESYAQRLKDGEPFRPRGRGKCGER